MPTGTLLRSKGGSGGDDSIDNLFSVIFIVPRFLPFKKYLSMVLKTKNIYISL
jgi:hypothetical protein